MDKHQVVDLITIGWLFITIPCFTLGLFVSPIFTIIGWIVVIFQYIWLLLINNRVAYDFAEWLIELFRK